jgi:DNA polymerase-3 subunit beta
LAGLPPEDFPSIPEIDFESGYSIPQNELFELIKRVVIAMTQEEGRFFINGALLQRVADGLVMVATDGHRLAYYKKKMDLSEKKEEKKAELKTVVAKKVLSELLKIIDLKSVDPVIFDVKGNFIYFYIAPRLLVARLLEASFPNYKEAIEIDLDKKMIIPRVNLSNAVRRVSLFANERAKGITLKFSENSIDLASRSPELGNASEKIGCQYNDETFKVGFNADYLLDFLNVVDDEEVIAEFRTVNKRAVFRQTKESIDEYRYVVMPMDVGEEEL